MKLAALAIACAVSVTLAGCRERECAFPAEAARPLDLRNETDRAHLDADVAAAERIAAEYGAWVAAQPLPAAARVSAAEFGEHARAYCQALSAEQIAVTHRLDLKTIERVQLTKR